MGRVFDLLKNAGGESSLSGGLGKWRQTVSEALDASLPWPGSICSGPLVNGAVRDILPAASLYPTDVVWYKNATKTTELLRQTFTRDGSNKVTQILWTIRNLSGDEVFTVTDVITYSGLYEIERTRTVA